MGLFDTSMVRYIMDSLPSLEETLRLTAPRPEWPVKTSDKKEFTDNVSGRRTPMADWRCPHCASWNDSQSPKCAGCSAAVSTDFLYGYSLGCEDVKQLLLKLKKG